MEFLTLNTGAKMPLEGFGVFQIPDAAQCEQVVYDAIKTGYRLLDTAAAYMNEEALGKGVARAIADGLTTREKLFITTKVWVQDQKTEETAYEAVKTSLSKLNMSYVDLVLLHQPFSDYYGAYRALEDLYDEGKLRAIGVSNFYPDRLVDIASFSRVKPMVNQVETHPFNQQVEAKKWMDKYGIQMEAWAPFGEGRGCLFENPVLVLIAEKYQKTTAQIILRWHIQRGVIVIPKSTHKSRMEENLNVFDFALEQTDMDLISELDKKQSSFFLTAIRPWSSGLFERLRKEGERNNWQSKIANPAAPINDRDKRSVPAFDIFN